MRPGKLPLASSVDPRSPPKLPNSCPTGAGQLLRAPRFWPKFAGFWPMWSNFWQVLAERSQHRPNWAEFRRIRAVFGQSLANSRNTWSTLVEVSARKGQILVSFGQWWPDLATEFPISANADEHSPNFGQNLGARSSFPAPFGHLLGKFGAIMEVTGIAGGDFPGRAASNASAVCGFLYVCCQNRP